MNSLTKQANSALPEDLLQELKSTIPKWEQSRVVAEGLRNELKRIKFKKALQPNCGTWKDEKHSELRRGTRRFIRSLRKSSRLKGFADK
ncbi:hypothetical protein MYX04_12165 [Nitrospiraceae bacterium AH_259_D15_M11_P09]|nr:hypothetical protein [Nitrospiraceae bacterium AH_259_D15_M11_P09]